jgi:hypothetical protein
LRGSRRHGTRTLPRCSTKPQGSPGGKMKFVFSEPCLPLDPVCKSHRWLSTRKKKHHGRKAKTGGVYRYSTVKPRDYGEMHFRKSFNRHIPPGTNSNHCCEFGRQTDTQIPYQQDFKKKKSYHRNFGPQNRRPQNSIPWVSNTGKEFMGLPHIMPLPSPSQKADLRPICWCVLGILLSEGCFVAFSPLTLLLSAHTSWYC